jgi:hypothetical protein
MDGDKVFSLILGLPTDIGRPATVPKAFGKTAQILYLLFTSSR